MSSKAALIDLGLTSYEDAWSLQHKLLQARVEGRVPDTLILLEHPHVLTIGRKGKEENIFTRNLPTYRVERGGDVTYHGPGQLVGYPIMKIDENNLDIHRLLRNLEEVLIRTLGEWGLQAERNTLQTGVWLKGKKIASIGIAVQRWVTFHGFALNVNTDLSYFTLINPCGLDSKIMTSMREALGYAVDLAIVKKSAVQHFEEVFGLELAPAEASDLNLPPIGSSLPYPERVA